MTFHTQHMLQLWQRPGVCPEQGWAWLGGGGPQLALVRLSSPRRPSATPVIKRGTKLHVLQGQLASLGPLGQDPGQLLDVSKTLTGTDLLGPALRAVASPHVQGRSGLVTRQLGGSQ